MAKIGPGLRRGGDSGRRDWLAALAVYRRPRLIAVLLMGFSSGLPLALTFGTLSYWLAELGVSLTAIGLFGLVRASYSLKFLWSPLIDRLPIPFLTRALGRRRSWALTIQFFLALAILGLGMTDPKSDPALTALAAVVVAFLSASQDIVIDAWRIELFPPRLQGAAMAAYVWGYRIALLISTTGVIAAAARVGWHVSLLGVAALIALGVFVTLLAPEPHGAVRQAIVGFAARMRHAVLEPLAEFLSRPGAIGILVFVALFKLGEAMAGIMTAPFYHALGFSQVAIAATGPFSLVATLAGITLGGWLVARIGVGRALLWTGWAQTIAMAMYVWLSLSAGNHRVLYGTVSIEAFAQGMADAAFITYLSGLCSMAFTATHYALLSSVAALTVHTLGGFSGVLAVALGWTHFYILCSFAALPAMLLMVWLLRRYPPAEQ
jgi:MFS transporter, PAT family, beta-lactamase induction signal transducer AmpG